MWDIFDKELTFGHTKNLQHKEKKGQITQLKPADDLNQHLSTENTQMANTHEKRLTNTSHLGNTNQNQKETPLHTH